MPEVSKWHKIRRWDYFLMRARHAYMWGYLRAYAELNNVTSVLDVGAGIDGHAKRWEVPYQAIDLNPRVDGIQADFLKMNVSELGYWDMVIIAGVVNHHISYLPFLEQIEKLDPRIAIITFFNMSPKRKRHRTTTNRRGIMLTRFSEKVMKRDLAEKCQRNWRLKRLGRHDFLLFLTRKGE
jgi:hypothetical protein